MFMTEAQENDKLAQVARKMEPGGRLLRVWPLAGGVSAQMTALEIERADGRPQKMIVRLHGEIDRKNNPQIAADEFRLLQLLRSTGLPVPEPYYLDQSCEIFSIPYVVIEYIEGKTELTSENVPDLIDQFTTCLSNIHRVDCAKLDVSFLPPAERRYDRLLSERPANLDASLDEGQVRDVLEAIWPLPRRNALALLHGDYWPGNILWREGQLVAIIDWEDAVLGDPLADLANSRVELMWAYGSDAMRQFTRQYQSMNAIDFTNLPYWDLCAALRKTSQISSWGLDDALEKTMREGLRLFIDQAFERLSVS
jgi:aminoglycoside phosphotransferase (APT) family kinase protein